MSQTWSVVVTDHYGKGPVPYDPTFISLPARVSPHMHSQQQSALLSSPKEVRDAIYRVMFEDVVNNPSYDWSGKPRCEYNGITLACKKSYFDTCQLWPMIQVPKHRIEKFFNLPYVKSTCELMTRLSLEVPFDAPPWYYDGLAGIFQCRRFGMTLEHLQLFFFGADTHGTPTGIHPVCGMLESSVASSERKLPIDAQRHQDRQALFIALSYLNRLRTLVVSNPNYPLLEAMIIRDKPRLEKLSITTDPRSTLHQDHYLSSIIQVIHAPSRNFPPIKTLEISANAVLTSLNLVRKVVHTLEHLTWVVPDASRQSSNLGQYWYHQTGVLLDYLGQHGALLKTLRICIEGTLYEGSPQYGEFISGFRHSLPNLRALESLEIHLTSRSPWLAEEVVNAVPASVIRLYISDSFIPMEKLERAISERYLDNGKAASKSCHQKYSQGLPGGICAQEMIVAGEELKRMDYVDLSRGGALSFIGVQYWEAKFDAVMVRLNGRLLDRQRNKHLAAFTGTPIPPQLRASDAEPPMEAHADIFTEPKDWKPTKGEVYTNRSILDVTGFRDDPNDNYFGGELQAVEVFANEACAKPEMLLGLKWLEVVGVGEHEHWMCG